MVSPYINAVFILATIVIVNATITVFNQSNETVDVFGDYEVLNGGEMIPEGRGLIVMANPIDACMPIKEPRFPNVSVSIVPMVLIYGNTSFSCSAAKKVAMADNAGFEVAIMYGANPFTQNHYVDPELDITALTVDYSTGIQIGSKYIYSNRSSKLFWIRITPNPPQDITYYIMLFSVVIGVCLIIMILFMICLLIKCLQERRRNQRNRLTSSQVRRLATEKFTAGDHYDVCAICLEDYKEGDKLRILPCSHTYHVKCIDRWLLKNRRTCPICNRKIRFGDSDTDSDSESELSSPAENRPLLPASSGHGDEAAASSSSDYRRQLASMVNVLLEQAQADLHSNSSSSSHASAEHHSSGHFNPVVDTQDEDVNSIPRNNHVSAYGSVNNSDGEEFVDALSPKEGHISSVVNV